jgi:hypothetical protein|tara:strand:+ start:3216 stop:3488 length:273 start_codon:yes stop_codon:yes gene_type:complete
MVSCLYKDAETESVMAKKWIDDAIKKPGALRKQMGIKKGDTIPAAKLNKESTRLRKKAERGKTLSKEDSTKYRRVRLAQTLRKMNRPGKS